MTDQTDPAALVKRLRDRGVCSLAHNSCRNDFICEEAAYRIEELEADLFDKEAECRHLRGECNMTKAKLAEAAKALRGLRDKWYLTDLTQADFDDTLAKIKGETDDQE